MEDFEINRNMAINKIFIIAKNYRCRVKLKNILCSYLFKFNKLQPLLEFFLKTYVIFQNNSRRYYDTNIKKIVFSFSLSLRKTLTIPLISRKNPIGQNWGHNL